jgi:catechol 2,3-dioxygenase-like lactoylglutathione lyase family enzyme
MTEKKGLTLPPLAHIGVVVKNLKEAIEYYSTVFGIGPFTIGPFEDGDFVLRKQLVKGKPVNGVLVNTASAQIGPIDIELLEPVRDGPHKWFLDSKGEGVQHLGFVVENCDAWIDYARQQGIEILLDAELDLPRIGRVRAVYLESDKPGGVIVELSNVTPFK